MTKSEQFAINEWLCNYPKDATFDDILYLLLDPDDETVMPWNIGSRISRTELANAIANTETHFFSVTKDLMPKN